MNWIPRSNTSLPNSELLEKWASLLEVSPMLVALLWSRGFETIELMQEYLNPSLKMLAPLSLWPGLESAAEFITSKVLQGEKIAVWGDYDVDGITSTALVVDFFKAHNLPCFFHIPNRLTEGYGLNKESITDLYNQGITLILTVDSGISDVSAVTHAKSLGMSVVISDHHLPAEILPPADAIVNPRLAPCPCPSLAGVGVAFFLVAAINACLADNGYKKYDIRKLLDLVALGTLADVVSLEGQNRILVKNGLLAIAQGSRPGIGALKTVSKFSPAASLGASQVVYSLTPRINAAGRLGSAQAALDLLLASEAKESILFADSLEALNIQRREEESSIVKEAHEQAKDQVEAGRMGLVVYHPSWHQGVIGIVASRIVESFHRPVVVLTETGDFLKGSGRSIASFDIHDAFAKSSHTLRGYGGHKMAAGLSLHKENLHSFSELFDDIAKESFAHNEPIASCKIDAILPLEYASDFMTLKELELMQPFGNGNPEPVFVSRPLLVKAAMYRPNFCMLDVVEPGSATMLRAKAWRSLAESIPKDIKGKSIIIAYSPRIDRYNGVASVELRMKDWKFANDTNIEFMQLPLS